ncbi:MAG TPA: hypothetical protein VFY92_10765, partial [Hyphomicrobiaceae bacterium]|nr:hypothetical protein [Hyphomicrobiaceae bacterium]
MNKAKLLVVFAILFFLPPPVLAVDRSECKQYGGSTDCWEPIVGPWKYSACAEVGSFGSWSAASCKAQGGQWLFGNCQNLPPVEMRRPLSEGDISALATDIYTEHWKPLCSGPNTSSFSWGVPNNTTLCVGGQGA